MRKQNKEREHFFDGFIALCQSRSSSFISETKRGILRYPASALAPGSALGLLPSSALSSVQVDPHCSRLQLRSKPLLISPIVEE
jgi:hypothetical protein